MRCARSPGGGPRAVAPARCSAAPLRGLEPRVASGRLTWRSSRCGPRVETPRRTSSRRAPARATASSPSKDRRYSSRDAIGCLEATRCAGEHLVGGVDERLEICAEALSGVDEARARLGQPLVPDVEGDRHLVTESPRALAEQGGALAKDAVDLVAQRAGLGVEQRQCVVEQVAPRDGAPRTTTRSSGEKTVTGTASARVRRSRAGCRLTWMRDRPAATSSASTRKWWSRPVSDARTTARSSPVLIITSRGAPRKERCVRDRPPPRAGWSSPSRSGRR